MEVVSKPCQDQLLHPILVHYRKNKKIQVASDNFGQHDENNQMFLGIDMQIKAANQLLNLKANNRNNNYHNNHGKHKGKFKLNLDLFKT